VTDSTTSTVSWTAPVQDPLAPVITGYLVNVSVNGGTPTQISAAANAKSAATGTKTAAKPKAAAKPKVAATRSKAAAKPKAVAPG
jgi:hypothetical protein